MVRKISFAALCVMALSGTAIAEDRGVPGVDVDINTSLSMPMADKNSDGKVTRAEAAGNTRLTAQFEKLDGNKDGALDSGEFARFESTAKAHTHLNTRLAAQFEKLDANKDGALDKGEFAKIESTASVKGKVKSAVPGNKDGAPGVDEGTGDERANTNDTPGTLDDSVPGNQDKLGPGR